MTTTQQNLETLAKKHDRVIEIFGGALWINPTDPEQVILYLPTIIRHAKLWKWHDTLANACRTYCHILLIDPMLIEAYIGMTFENLIEKLNA